MKQRIKIIKRIDSFSGPFLLRLLPKAKYLQKPPSNIKKILIVRPGGMGDAVLLLPIIKEVRDSLPDVIIHILCETRNSGIFRSVKYINRFFHYDNPLHLLKLMNNNYDIIIDTEQSYYLSAFLCWFLKGRMKIGFNTCGRGDFFNKSFNYTQNKYEVIVFWDLFREVLPVNKKFKWRFPYFSNIGSGFKFSEDFRNRPGKIVCIFPGASKKECKWPVEYWADVINSISDSGNIPVLLGGGLELATADKILKLCRADKLINYTNRLSLFETSQLFNHANLLITTDSGILHLGVICDVATISLFGAGNTIKWGPSGQKHIIITKNLNCSPCAMFGSIPPCSNKDLCMKKITSNIVIDACMDSLKK